LAFFVLFSTCFCAYSKGMFVHWLFWLYVVAGCCMGLSFLVFWSEFCKDNKCKVAQGSGCALMTVMLWLLCAHMVKSIRGCAPVEGPKQPKDAPHI